MTRYNFPNSKYPTLHNLQYYSRITREKSEGYPRDENGEIVANHPKVKVGSSIMQWADRESSKKSRTVVEYGSLEARDYDYGELLPIIKTFFTIKPDLTHIVENALCRGFDLFPV